MSNESDIKKLKKELFGLKVKIYEKQQEQLELCDKVLSVEQDILYLEIGEVNTGSKICDTLRGKGIRE